MPNEVKLLPCPLCGDKDDYNPSVGTTYKYVNPGTECTDLVESGHMIECDKCGCCGPIAPVEEEAVRLWNTRPTTVVTDEVVERVVSALKQVNNAKNGWGETLENYPALARAALASVEGDGNARSE